MGLTEDDKEELLELLDAIGGVRMRGGRYFELADAYSAFHYILERARGHSERQSLLMCVREYSNRNYTPDISKEGLIIPITWGDTFPILIRDVTMPSNRYVRLAGEMIGGGASRLTKACSMWARIDGGVCNVRRGMELFVRDYVRCPDVPNYGWYARDILPTVRMRYFNFKEDQIDEYALNPYSSIGAVQGRMFHGLGLKRLQAVLLNLPSWMRYRISWARKTRNPEFPPPLIWTPSTRGKLMKLRDVRTKIRALKPLCRTICMTDPVEHFMFYPLYHGVMACLKDTIAVGNAIIYIGVKKKSQDWISLGSKISEWRWILCLDWSNFDASVPGELLSQAWDLFIAMCDRIFHDTGAYRNYKKNAKIFYEHNFIASHFVSDQYAFNKVGGIPSGSLLTSIIGSLVNYIILRNICSDIGFHLGEYRIFVYGDDAVVCMSKNEPLPMSGNDLKNFFVVKARERYGMELSPEKSRLIRNSHPYVGYSQPIYSEDEGVLRLGTGGLTPRGYRRFDSPPFTYDYLHGVTHRIDYDFTDRPSFLGCYFDYVGRPIMSTMHSMVRLVNPEKGVKSLTDAMERVRACVLDNCYNMNVRNYGFHLEYALYEMVKKRGVTFTPKGFDIYMYGKKREEMSDDFGAMITEDNIMNELSIFYRKANAKIELIKDARTAPHLMEYEKFLEVNGHWSDLKIDHDRICVVRGDWPVQVDGIDIVHHDTYKRSLFGEKGMDYLMTYSWFSRDKDFDIKMRNDRNTYKILCWMSYIRGFFGEMKYGPTDFMRLPLDCTLTLGIDFYTKMVYTLDTPIHRERMRLNRFSGNVYKFEVYLFAQDSEIMKTFIRFSKMFAYIDVLNRESIKQRVNMFYFAGVRDSAIPGAVNRSYRRRRLGDRENAWWDMGNIHSGVDGRDDYDILLHEGQIRSILYEIGLRAWVLGMERRYDLAWFLFF
uniref:Putative replicase n=1 Tax=Gutsystermes virus TaxID=2796592 RepID=A0A7T7K910_9VIRU|nr:putative replicase [Gutsystermes virus]